MAHVYRGKVRNFEADKRYGFLLCQELSESLGKPEIFVHASSLVEPSMESAMKPGLACTFTLGMDGKKKPMATNVALESSNPPRSVPRRPSLSFEGSNLPPAAAAQRSAAPVANDLDLVTKIELMAGVRFPGTTKYYLREKQYGFLQSDGLIPVLGKNDVFVHATHVAHLGGDLQTGQQYYFSLAFDDRGRKPMAIDIQVDGEVEIAAPQRHLQQHPRGGFAPEEAAADTWNLDSLLGQRFVGVVKFFSPEKHYGFLFCEALAEAIGKEDVFVHENHMNNIQGDFQPGMVYSFKLAKDEKNKPMAIDLVLEPEMTLPVGQAAGPERYRGYVKLFNAEKGFGFLVCDELAAHLGKSDVFVHQSKIEQPEYFQEGTSFTFGLGMDPSGKPMAVDLAPDFSEPPRKRMRIVA